MKGISCLDLLNEGKSGVLPLLFKLILENSNFCNHLTLGGKERRYDMMTLSYDEAVVHIRREVLSASPLTPMSVIMRCIYPGGISCKWHSKNTACQNHATLVLSGNIVFQERNRQEFPCGPGDILIFPKGCEIRWRTGGEATLLICVHSPFDFTTHGILASLAGSLQEHLECVQAGSELALKIEQRLIVAKVAHAMDVAYSLTVLEFLWAALEAQRTLLPRGAKGAQGRNPLLCCLDYIERNLDRDISLDVLMQISSLGASRLSQLFRENLGMPPLHYVAKRKIEVAERLLLAGGISVGEVAERLGFKTLNYFSRVFKRKTGRQPSAIFAKK